MRIEIAAYSADLVTTRNLNRVAAYSDVFGVSTKTIVPVNTGAYSGYTYLVIGDDPNDFRIESVPNALTGVTWSAARMGGLQELSFTLAIEQVDLDLVRGDRVRLKVYGDLATQEYVGFVNEFVTTISDRKESTTVQVLGYCRYNSVTAEITGGEFWTDEFGAETPALRGQKIVDYLNNLINGKYEVSVTPPYTIDINGLKDYSPIKALSHSIDPLDDATDNVFTFSGVQWYEVLEKLVTYLNAKAGSYKYYWDVAEIGGVLTLHVGLVSGQTTYIVPASPYRITKSYGSESCVVVEYEDLQATRNEKITSFYVKTATDRGFVPPRTTGAECNEKVLNWSFTDATVASVYDYALNLFTLHNDSNLGSMTVVHENRLLHPYTTIEVVVTGGATLVYDVGAVSYVPSFEKGVTASITFGGGSSLDRGSSSLYSRIKEETEILVGELGEQIIAFSDTTPPDVQVSLSPITASKPNVIGSPLILWASVTDEGSGVESAPVAQVWSGDTGPYLIQQTMTADGDYFTTSLDLSGITKGTKLHYRVMAVDRTGNIGYSGTVEGVLDDTSPDVTFTVKKAADLPETGVQPQRLEHGTGWLIAKISDDSATASVTCSHGTLVLVPGALPTDKPTWQGAIDIGDVPVRDVSVTVTDIFGNSGTHTETFWNSDHPLPVELDRTGPSVSVATSPSTPKRTEMGIGSPLVVYAQPVDAETAIDPTTVVLEIGRTGYTYPTTVAMTADPEPGWYVGTCDIKAAGWASGDLIYYRVRCDDIAGNRGYSSVTEGVVDGIPPAVAVRAMSYDSGSVGDSGTGYDEIKGDLRFRITVADASAIKELWAKQGAGAYYKIWDRAGGADGCYLDPDDTDGNAWLYDVGRSYKGKIGWDFKAVDIFGNYGRGLSAVDHKAKDTTSSDPTTQEVVEGYSAETTAPDIHGSHVQVGTMPSDRLLGGVNEISETVTSPIANTANLKWRDSDGARVLTLSAANTAVPADRVPVLDITAQGDIILATHNNASLGQLGKSWFKVFASGLEGAWGSISNLGAVAGNWLESIKEQFFGANFGSGLLTRTRQEGVNYLVEPVWLEREDYGTFGPYAPALLGDVLTLVNDGEGGKMPSWSPGGMSGLVRTVDGDVAEYLGEKIAGDGSGISAAVEYVDGGTRALVRIANTAPDTKTVKATTTDISDGVLINKLESTDSTVRITSSGTPVGTKVNLRAQVSRIADQAATGDMADINTITGNLNVYNNGAHVFEFEASQVLDGSNGLKVRSGAGAERLRLARDGSIQAFGVDGTTLVWGINLSGAPVLGLRDGVVQSVYGTVATPTAGSIPYTGADQSQQALLPGTNGHVLTLAAGVPSWAAPTGGTGGQVDRIQDPTDSTTYLKVDDATGDLCYYRDNDLIARFFADGDFETYTFNGDKVFHCSATGGVEFWGGGATKQWGIDLNGVAVGVKLGFKAG